MCTENTNEYCIELDKHSQGIHNIEFITFKTVIFTGSKYVKIVPCFFTPTKNLNLYNRMMQKSTAPNKTHQQGLVTLFPLDSTKNAYRRKKYQKKRQRGKTSVSQFFEASVCHTLM